MDVEAKYEILRALQEMTTEDLLGFTQVVSDQESYFGSGLTNHEVGFMAWEIWLLRAI